jgi:hypothetical protein
MLYYITQQRHNNSINIIKMPKHWGAIVGGGGIGFNNISFPRDLTSRPGFSTDWGTIALKNMMRMRQALQSDKTVSHR